MSLREELQDWVPMYLWEKIEHPEGYIVSNEEFNARWNLTQVQGDQQAGAIRDILALLFDTVWNDEDGASSIKITLAEYEATNLKDVLLEIDRKLKASSVSLGAHINSGDHDYRYYVKQEVDSKVWGTPNIADKSITLSKIDPSIIVDMQLVKYISIAETIQRRLEIISILGV